MALLCKHKWEVVDKHVFDAPLDVAKRNDIGSGYGAATLYHEGALTQKVTWILQCSVCGKSRTVSSSV